MACEARHAPSGPRAGRAPCAHARPAPCVVLFVSLAVEGLSLRACTVSFVISKDTLAVLRALARRPPLCPSVLSVLLCVLRNLRFPLHRASCIFVVLREPSCQPRRVNLPHSPSGSIRRALVARPVAVEGLALRACTLCSLFFGRRQPPIRAARERVRERVSGASLKGRSVAQATGASARPWVPRMRVTSAEQWKGLAPKKSSQGSKPGARRTSNRAWR